MYLSPEPLASSFPFTGGDENFLFSCDRIFFPLHVTRRVGPRLGQRLLGNFHLLTLWPWVERDLCGTLWDSFAFTGVGGVIEPLCPPTPVHLLSAEGTSLSGVSTGAGAGSWRSPQVLGGVGRRRRSPRDPRAAGGGWLDLQPNPGRPRAPGYGWDPEVGGWMYFLLFLGGKLGLFQKFSLCMYSHLVELCQGASTGAGLRSPGVSLGLPLANRYPTHIDFLARFLVSRWPSCRTLCDVSLNCVDCKLR